MTAMLGVKFTDHRLRCSGNTLIRKGWTRHVDHIEPCKSGWHWVPVDTGLPLEWCRQRCRLVLDHEGRIDEDGKAVSHRLLIGEEVTAWLTIARLVAADCAASVLDLADDEACDHLVDVARRFAWGEATRSELDIAWASARANARASIRDSAMASARASIRASAMASARASVEYSAWAWASAGYSAWASAWASAWDSARASAGYTKIARASAGDSAKYRAVWVSANRRTWTYLHAWANDGIDGVRSVDPWPRGVRLTANNVIGNVDGSLVEVEG